MMIRCNVGPRVHRKQAEGLADMGIAPDARHAEPAMIFHREQPFIEPLLRLVGRIGEFVETVAEDKAALGAKIAALGADIIDWLHDLSRPAPAPLAELPHPPAVPRLPDNPP